MHSGRLGEVRDEEHQGLEKLRRVRGANQSEATLRNTELLYWKYDGWCFAGVTRVGFGGGDLGWVVGWLTLSS